MPKGKNGPLPSRQFDSRAGHRIGADIQRVAAEIEERKRAGEKDDEHGDRHQRDESGDDEGQLDAARIQPHKNRVAEHPPERLQFDRRLENSGEIGADEEDDHGGRQHIFDILGDAGDEPAPWTECRAGKGVSAAGMRQRRAHLGDGEGEAEKHHHDDKGADEHAAPAAG